MTLPALCSLCALTFVPPTVWRDPERTLAIRASDLEPDLRLLLEDPAPPAARISQILQAHPESFEAHAAVRAALQRHPTADFARQAVGTAEQNTQRFQPPYPRWRTRKVLEAGMRMFCYRLTERGMLKIEKKEQSEWYRASQSALVIRPSSLRSVDEAYLLLSVFRSLPFRLREARVFLEGCRKRFGPSVGMDVYTARLYTAAIGKGWKTTLNARNVLEQTIMPAVPADGGRVKEAALRIWASSSSDPGAVAVAATALVQYAHPRAKEAAAAYLKTNDPELDRLHKLESLFPESFGKEGRIGFGSAPARSALMQNQKA